MTKHTRAIGKRLLSSLKNENIVVATDPTDTIRLCDAKGTVLMRVRDINGRYVLREDDGEIMWAEDYAQLVRFIKESKVYPAPKARAPKMAASYRHAPQVLAWRPSSPALAVAE